MYRLIVLGALCMAVLAQNEPQGPPHGRPGPPGSSHGTSDSHRVARQAPPMPGMGQMPGGGMPGNAGPGGMSDMTNPTAWIKKGKEVMSEIATGRRRRNA